MSHKWRWSLLGILIAVVIVGLVPNAFGAQTVARADSTLTATAAQVFTPQSVKGPYFANGCLDASCGKGVPAPASPVLTLVAAAILAGALSLFIAGRRTRRLRMSRAVLPQGIFRLLFHPPQSS